MRHRVQEKRNLRGIYRKLLGEKMVYVKAKKARCEGVEVPSTMYSYGQ